MRGSRHGTKPCPDTRHNFGIWSKGKAGARVNEFRSAIRSAGNPRRGCRGPARLRLDRRRSKLASFFASSMLPAICRVRRSHSSDWVLTKIQRRSYGIKGLRKTKTPRNRVRSVESPRISGADALVRAAPPGAAFAPIRGSARRPGGLPHSGELALFRHFHPCG